MTGQSLQDRRLDKVGGLMVVLGGFAFLGSCLGCVSHHYRHATTATPGRRSESLMTSQEVAAVLRLAVVGFVNHLPKDEILPNRSPWTRPGCTGWFVAERTLVTASHCFRDTIMVPVPGLPEPVEVVGQEVEIGQVVRFVRPGQQRAYSREVWGRVGLARITDLNRGQDLAVLTLLTGTKGVRESEFLHVTSRDPVPGDTVYSLGNSPTLPWVFSEGLVSRVVRDEPFTDGSLSGGFVQTSIGMTRGFSGSPVVNVYGEVVGVTNSINPQGNISILSPWWSVTPLWFGTR